MFADVVSLIEEEYLTDVILVGHSYPGPVVSSVANAVPERDRAPRLPLSSLGQVFHCYRFDRVSPGAARSVGLAKHTAELRYPFGTLLADGYDETDRQVSSWMQVQSVNDHPPARRWRSSSAPIE